MVNGIVIPQDEEAQVYASSFERLEDYQRAVGGYVETVHIEGQKLTLLANEEGKMRRMSINRRATGMWWLLSPEARGHDVLVGDVAVLGYGGGGNLSAEVPAAFRTLLLETPRYRIEMLNAVDDVNWRVSFNFFDSYFEAALAAVVLLHQCPTVVDARVIPA